MARTKGAKNATEDEKRHALSVLAEHCGNARRASESLPWSHQAVLLWRAEFPEWYGQEWARHAAEVRNEQLANVRKAWKDSAAIAKKAGEMAAMDLLLDARDLRALQATVLEFARSAEHVLRLDAGTPTARVEHVEAMTDEQLEAAHEAAFEKALQGMTPEKLREVAGVEP